MPVYRIDRVAINGKTGKSLFWFVECDHKSVAELCDDLRDRKIITVDQLVTERGDPGFAVIVGRVTLGVTLAAVDAITVPNLRFVEADRGD